VPVPDRQAVVRRPGGRYYLDVHWAAYATGTEIHGTQHIQIRTWDADLDRHNELTAGGRRILQFSSYSVRHRQDHVGAPWSSGRYVKPAGTDLFRVLAILRQSWRSHRRERLKIARCAADARSRAAGFLRPRRPRRLE
jgi:hypothetical protein